MTEPQPDQQDTAGKARDAAVVTAVSVLVQLGVLVAISGAITHRRAITARARHLAARARGQDGRRAHGLQVADFARRVSDYDHGDRL